MLHKIDYLSYTFLIERKKASDGWLPGLEAFLKEHMPKYIQTDGESKRAPRRLGFDLGYAFNNHTYVWVNERGLFLVEHTGQGCDDLNERGLLLSLVREQHANVTRIDIATDILCDVRPLDFTNERESEKASAIGHIKSDSGETVYLGARKSQRTCRVYRYDGKHPRAGFLRIEYTYRREDAKIVCNRLQTGSIEEIALISAERYKWKHEVWKPAENAGF